MANTIPKFGCAGTVISVEDAGSSEMVELPDGLSITRFLLKTTNTFKKEKDIHSAYGIAASGAGGTLNSLGVKIVSATYTNEEVVGGTVQEPTAKFNVSGGAVPAVTDKLTYTNGMLWLRSHETLTIEGKGSLPTALSADKKGTTLTETTIMLASATASDVVITFASPTYIDYRTNNTNTEFATWSVTLDKYTENATPDSEILAVGGADTDLDAFSLIEEADLTSVYFKGTLSLTFGENAYVRRTETVELYDDADVPL